MFRLNFLSDREKLIFLHFANRELFEACSQRIDHSYAADVLEILSVTHCRRMTANISQFIEFCGDSKKLLHEGFDLASKQVILFFSQSASFSEFIPSRQKIYTHDKSRYPMYFDDKRIAELSPFPIFQTSQNSTTAALTRLVSNWDPSSLVDPINMAMRPKELDSLLPLVDKIRGITIKESGRAITKALYYQHLGQEMGAEQKGALARMISGIYVHHNTNGSGYATCTGVNGVSYYDNYAHFPNYDVIILRNMLDGLGYYQINGRESPSFRDQRIELYGGQLHVLFTGTLNTFAAALSAQFAPVGGAWPARREAITSTFKSAVGSWGSSKKVRSLKEFYERGCEEINKYAAELSARNLKEFIGTWTESITTEDNGMKKVLILTATDVEDEALDGALLACGLRDEHPFFAQNVAVRSYSPYRGIKLFHVRSSAGSEGPSGSSLVAKDAISIIEPDYVISVGICFGTKKDKNKICDIIVSTEIFDYESGRQSRGGKFTPRGAKYSASPRLLSATRMLKVRWGGANVDFGLIASGAKLVDDKKYVTYLCDVEPNTLAGEMEGSGIAAACTREKVDWIMIKSICDWGFDKNKEHQLTAAKNSVSFLIELINNGILAQ